MTGWPVKTAQDQAAALQAAFPSYTVTVIPHYRGRPRIEAISRDGGNPWCLISDEAHEIWRELRGAASKESGQSGAGGTPCRPGGRYPCRFVK